MKLKKILSPKRKKLISNLFKSKSNKSKKDLDNNYKINLNKNEFGIFFKKDHNIPLSKKVEIIFYKLNNNEIECLKSLKILILIKILIVEN